MLDYQSKEKTIQKIAYLSRATAMLQLKIFDFPEGPTLEEFGTLGICGVNDGVTPANF